MSSQTKCIFLTGFMGSGKSRIGKLLSQKLSRPFIDTDAQIELEQQQSIQDIFSEKGEAHFRTLEEQLITQILPDKRLIVSLGGGAIISEKTRKHIAEGIWIFLNPPFEELQTRVARKSHRPLAKDPEKFASLYQERLPLYQQASIIIDCEGSVEDVCQLILQKLISNHD